MFFTFIAQVLKDIGKKLSKELLRRMPTRPMMRYREIDLISELIKRNAPNKVLEWGCGYSTLYYPIFLSAEASWLAIEHQTDWANRVVELNENPNVHIKHINLDNPNWSNDMGDGSLADFKQYVQHSDSETKFDMILIDGRARTDCLDRARELLSENGFVILHDANRTMYHHALSTFEHQEFFLDYRKSSGGVWIGSYHKPITELMNVKRQKSLWDFYNSNIAAIFGF